MDPRSPSDSDGAGDTPHDEGTPQPQSHGDPPDPPGLSTAAPLLSLEQIRVTRSSNEYTEGPTVAPRSPASQQHKAHPVTGPSTAGGPQETREERPNNLRNLRPSTPHGEPDRDTGAQEDSRGVRTSVGSSGSGQRLLGSPIIRTQPHPEELKPLSGTQSRPLVVVAAHSVHSDRCEDCGRCLCAECRRPRVLPSCWTCGRRCMCSVQSAVEYGTCACCLKGLFYHCSSDDEDTCADKPFSCSQPRCCVRWSAASLLSLLLPCLLCYLPAKGCVYACQSCYDRAARPGCRCKQPTTIQREEDVSKPA